MDAPVETTPPTSTGGVVQLKEVAELSPMLETQSGANSTPAGWSPVVILTATATTLSCGFSLGFHLSVINAPAQIITDFSNASLTQRYDLQLSHHGLNVLWSSIVSVLVIGAMVGSLSGGWIANRFGRKGAVFVNNIVGLLAAILFLISFYASSVELLIIGRISAGFSIGLTTSTVPMYLTEIAPARGRGALGCVTVLGLTIGLVISQVLGLKEVLGRSSTWHFLLASYAVPTLMGAVALLFVPESPRFLYVIQGKKQAGIKALSRLRGLPAEMLLDEVNELKAMALANQKQDSTLTILQLIRSPELRLPLLIVCLLQAGQTFSGINAVFFYSMKIFARAGLSVDAGQYATLGAGLLNLVAALVAVLVVDRFGRRPLLLLSATLCATSIFVLSLSLVCVDSAPWMPYICILAIFSYVLWYALALGPISNFIGAELFAEAARSAAMAVGSVVMWGSNFIVGMTFPLLQAEVGGYAFMPYAASTLMLLAFLKIYLPETRNKSPEMIQDMLRGKPGTKASKSKLAFHKESGDILNK